VFKENGQFLRPVVSLGGTAFVRMVALGLCLGAAIGIVATVSPLVAGALAVAVAAVAASRGHLPALVGLTLVVTIGVPVAAAGASGNAFLSLPLGPIHPPFQVFMVIGVVALTVILATSDTLSYLLSVLRRGASGVVLLWVCACFVLFVLGVGRNGLAVSGRQFMYLFVYIWVIPVIIVSRRRASRALSAFLALVLVGSAFSALMVLAAFVVPPLHVYFFSSTEWAGTARIYFGDASVYVLVLPIALVLAGNKSAGRLRVLGLVSSLLMIAGIVAAQTRAQMAACLFNVILVILLPGMGRLGVRRWRILGSSALIVLILVIALAMAGSLGIRNASVLPQELSERFGSLISEGSGDTNYQIRRITVGVAMHRWQRDPVTIASGQGLGATIGIYAPGNPTPHLNIWVDSVWATLAVQGGLIAMTTFALVLIGALVSFVRVARSPVDSLERLIGRALALSLPGLAFDSTFFTQHLLTTPGVIVALCTLLAAADVVWCSHRNTIEGGSSPP
jgi:hypothetical protein